MEVLLQILAIVAASVISASAAVFIASRGWRLNKKVEQAEQIANANIHSLALIQKIEDGYKISWERTDRELADCRKRTSVVEGQLQEMRRRHEKDKDEWMQERRELHAEISRLMTRLEHNA